MSRSLAVATLAAFLAACGGGGGGSGAPAPAPAPAPSAPVPNPNPTAPTQACSANGIAAAAQSTQAVVVCMLTSSGEMVIELFPADAPLTVANFLAYVNADYYDQTLIHRVDRDFVAQGGGFRPGMLAKAPLYAPPRWLPCPPPP